MIFSTFILFDLSEIIFINIKVFDRIIPLAYFIFIYTYTDLTDVLSFNLQDGGGVIYQNYFLIFHQWYNLQTFLQLFEVKLFTYLPEVQTRTIKVKVRNINYLSSASSGAFFLVGLYTVYLRSLKSKLGNGIRQ